jgi:hypothetical protein
MGERIDETLIRHSLSAQPPCGIRMNLIDWPSLVRNALWLLGLSVVLAAWSHLSWQAARREVRVWRAIGWAVFEVPASAGLALFAISLAWGATRTWERILWMILGVAFLAQMILGWRRARRQGWLALPPSVEALGQNAADGASDN